MYPGKQGLCGLAYTTVSLITCSWLEQAHFALMRVTHSRLRLSSVPMRFFASGAGSGLAVLSCIRSTISASFSSVVPVAS
jgi:hypothetical protein